MLLSWPQWLAKRIRETYKSPVARWIFKLFKQRQYQPSGNVSKKEGWTHLLSNNWPSSPWHLSSPTWPPTNMLNSVLPGLTGRKGGKFSLPGNSVCPIIYHLPLIFKSQALDKKDEASKRERNIVHNLIKGRHRTSGSAALKKYTKVTCSALDLQTIAPPLHAWEQTQTTSHFTVSSAETKQTNQGFSCPGKAHSSISQQLKHGYGPLKENL